MVSEKLKTAVLGLQEESQLLLEALTSCDFFRIDAVADTDTNIAKKTADIYKCDYYDDYRQLVMQKQYDCLLVTAGIHDCIEHIQTAMKRKCNILKLPPLARNFEEAAGLVRLAQNEKIKFAVADRSFFTQSYLVLQESVKQQSENIFLLEAACITGNQLVPNWQLDLKLAGGGVLLYKCWEIISQIIASFGLPQQIYAISTNQADDRRKRQYLTEDTIVVTMKFNDFLSGILLASKSFGPKKKYLTIYNRDGIIEVNGNQYISKDLNGDIKEQLQYNSPDKSGLTCMKNLLENFALSIISPQQHKLLNNAENQLKNMAVIESAYLSARTAMPEEPARILRMAQI